jgi:hypothetical protein
MKVIPTEFEPQVRLSTEAAAVEAPAPAQRIKRRRRVMLMPAQLEARLFHAL